MAFNIKLLGEGQLAVATAVIYTVPGATQTIIKTITLVNTDSVPRTVNLFIKGAATNRRIIPKDTSLGAGFLLETDQEYTLEAGDTIEGDASAVTIVDFTIHGVEEA